MTKNDMTPQTIHFLARMAQMRKKYLTSFFVILITLLSISGEINAAAQPRDTAVQQTGLLWRIERADLRPSYIFGTIHSDDPRVLQLPGVITQKLKEADSFVAELKLDTASTRAASRLMFLPPGQTLESLIGRPRYQKCIELLSRFDIPAAAVQRMKPWAVMIILSMPKPESGTVLDERLYQQAQSQGKKTYGLETNREQVAIFESFSLPQQIVMLDDAIKEFDQLPTIFEQLVRFYLQRDLTGLERISDKYMLQGDRKIAQSFKQRALLERNHRMVRRMKSRLQEGNSFIAVGALHLPGEEGILRLLQKEGYRVTPVY